jgi:hypothetical protein
MVCGACEEHEEPGNPSALKPYEGRRTTDFLFLIAIIALWVVMTIVGAIATTEGNPYNLVSPVDDEVRFTPPLRSGRACQQSNLFIYFLTLLPLSPSLYTTLSGHCRAVYVVLTMEY